MPCRLTGATPPARRLPLPARRLGERTRREVTTERGALPAVGPGISTPAGSRSDRPPGRNASRIPTLWRGLLKGVYHEPVPLSNAPPGRRARAKAYAEVRFTAGAEAPSPDLSAASPAPSSGDEARLSPSGKRLQQESIRGHLPCGDLWSSGIIATSAGLHNKRGLLYFFAGAEPEGPKKGPLQRTVPFKPGGNGGRHYAGHVPGRSGEDVRIRPARPSRP